MNEITREKQGILCIAPRYPNSINLNINIIEEWEQIKSVMRGTGSGFKVETENVRHSQEVVDLIQNTRPSPQIIHISGEGREPDGAIEIPDLADNTKGEFLEPKVLAEYFANAKDVEYVVLNFCFSKPAAELIASHVQCVIGIDGFIQGQAAVEFSKTFYRSLEGKPLDQNAVNEAFSKGKSAAFDRSRDEGKYVIFTQEIPQPEMQMKFPLEKSEVPFRCECSGTFKNLPQGATMWAYVNALLQGKFYVVAINDRTLSTDGEWRVTLLIGPEEDDNDYRIGVFMVDPENTPGFKSEYDKAINKDGFFALDSLPNNGAQIFSDRAVTRI